MASGNGSKTQLKALSAKLRLPGLPTQSAIAIGAGGGVDQAMVSRAANGEIKRVTGRVVRLIAYVDMRIAEFANLPAKANDPTTTTAIEERATATKRVLGVCRSYLSDGHDPQLLMDQVLLLKRAQKSPAGRPNRSAGVR